jgi:hypothetical protein
VFAAMFSEDVAQVVPFRCTQYQQMGTKTKSINTTGSFQASAVV